MINVNLSSHSNFSLVYGPPLGIPSFAWGLCCGLPGLAVVYFVADDKEETKKAFYGCVTSTVVGVVVNVAVLGAGGEIFTNFSLIIFHYFFSWTDSLSYFS